MTLKAKLINKVAAIVIIFCSYKQVYGQGGPPMITDDPGTVAKGHYEINSGITAELTTTESLFEFPFIDLNYGVSKRQHINFEVPVVSQFRTGFETQSGLGKLGIGTKLRFLDQDSAVLDISTHPAAYFVLSNNAVDKGIIENGTEIFIPVEFQKKFGKSLLGLECGWLNNSKSTAAWTYGMLFAREFSSVFNAAIEINGNMNPAFSATTLFVNLGTRVTMSQQFILLVSGGKSIVSPPGIASQYISYIGLQLAI